MRILLLCVFAFSFGFANHSHKVVKVLLEKDLSGVLVETRGCVDLYDLKAEKNLETANHSKRFWMYLDKSGLYWGKKFFNVMHLAFLPKNSQSYVLVNGIQYKGAVLVFGYLDKLTVVNAVSIEEYVSSILSDRQRQPLEFEAMCALAIAMRTHAVYSIEEHQRDTFHVDAKDVSYKGHAVTYQKMGIEEAVLSTKSLVMQSTKGDVVFGFCTDFSENCAGSTIPYHLIYRKDTKDLSKSVESVYAKQAREQSKWEAILDLDVLKQETGLDQISQIKPFVDPQSQKVYGLRISSETEFKDLDFLTLQKLYGKETLLSSDFFIHDIGKNTLHIVGFGRGTGVGLCVFSANEMAKLGTKAHKILNHFFPETRIEKIDRIQSIVKEETIELQVQD
ncbi:MAG: hypothetical protein K940chlam8_00104 [Chlamydiae bacterium]|nr:hypothetical protein [Chlamydiota bacterium]